MLTLKNITQDNFEEIIALDAGDNDKFIERNIYSIAEAKIIPEYLVEAIYSDEVPVGFVMYKFEGNNKRMYINRFMIDVNYQGKGFGSEAMKLLVNKSRENGLDILILHVHPENIGAINFYKKFGFIDTGRVSGGEMEFELVL